MNYLKNKILHYLYIIKITGKKELKKIDIRNHAYYFDYIIRVIDISSRDILLDKKNTKRF